MSPSQLSCLSWAGLQLGSCRQAGGMSRRIIPGSICCLVSTVLGPGLTGGSTAFGGQFAGGRGEPNDPYQAGQHVRIGVQGHLDDLCGKDYPRLRWEHVECPK